VDFFKLDGPHRERKRNTNLGRGRGKTAEKQSGQKELSIRAYGGELEGKETITERSER